MALGVVIAGSAIFSYEASRPTSGDSNHEELIVGLGAPTDPVLLDHDLETQDTENGMTANAPNSTGEIPVDTSSAGGKSAAATSVPASSPTEPREQETATPELATPPLSGTTPEVAPSYEAHPLADPFETAVARLPSGLRAMLAVATVTFGCHPEEGCHYGIWDYRTGTVWLSPNLLDDPELLYSVLSHELAHVADTHLYSDQLRGELYSQVPSYLNPGEALADCVTLASGGSWTYYWDCPSSGLRSQVAGIFSA